MQIEKIKASKNVNTVMQVIQQVLFAQLLLIILTTNFVYSQDELIVEKKNHSQRQKKIELDRTYKIKTLDKEYSSKIIYFSDSTLSIHESIKSGRDTSISEQLSKRLAKKQFGINHDTTLIKTKPLYVMDTVSIQFSEIEYLKTDWFRNQNWLSPFVLTGMVGLIGVAWLPFAASKGDEEVKEWAVTEAMLMGISLPTIFIGTRSTKYDLTKKWTLKRINKSTIR